MLSKAHKMIYGICSLSLFFIIWSILASYVQETPLLIPSPRSVIHRMSVDYKVFLFHAIMTFLEMLTGMISAIITSFIMAYAMIKVRIIKALLEPYFIVMQCLPMFTLAPLCIIWFGWSFISIMIPTALMIAFPLTINMYRGFNFASKQHLEFFRLHGASQWQLLFKIQLPFALPHLFAGLRVAAAISGVGAVAGEWAGAQRGLGVFLQICKRNFDLEGVFGAIFSLLLLSLFFYGIVVLLEKKFIKGLCEPAFQKE